MGFEITTPAEFFAEPRKRSEHEQAEWIKDAKNSYVSVVSNYFYGVLEGAKYSTLNIDVEREKLEELGVSKEEIDELYIKGRKMAESHLEEQKKYKVYKD